MDITRIMENQLEKHMQDETETGNYGGFKISRDYMSYC